MFLSSAYSRARLTAIVAVCAGCLTPALRAIVVTVNSAQYDVTTVSGTVAGLLPTLQNQPWWGNESAAFAFADAVGSQLGFPQTVIVPAGPYFGFELDGGFLRVTVYLDGLGSADLSLIDDTPGGTFAIARPVRAVPDAGTTIAMLGAALVVLAVLRQRLRKRSPLP